MQSDVLWNVQLPSRLPKVHECNTRTMVPTMGKKTWQKLYGRHRDCHQAHRTRHTHCNDPPPFPNTQRTRVTPKTFQVNLPTTANELPWYAHLERRSHSRSCQNRWTTRIPKGVTHPQTSQRIPWMHRIPPHVLQRLLHHCRTNHSTHKKGCTIRMGPRAKTRTRNHHPENHQRTSPHPTRPNAPIRA